MWGHSSESLAIDALRFLRSQSVSSTRALDGPPEERGSIARIGVRFTLSASNIARVSPHSSIQPVLQEPLR
jgi:hypothetical protein